MRKSIVIAGVGGQGQITIGSILGEVLGERGYRVSVGEVHGLSQRGGSVVVFVKYGDRAVSPIVTPGEADLIIGLELIETARRLPLAKKGAFVVANDFLLPPPSAEKVPPREELLKWIKAGDVTAFFIDARSLALKAGSELTVNVVMVGASLATGLIDASVEDVERALARRFKGEVLHSNLEALKLGYEEIKKQGQQL